MKEVLEGLRPSKKIILPLMQRMHLPIMERGTKGVRLIHSLD